MPIPQLKIKSPQKWKQEKEDLIKRKFKKIKAGKIKTKVRKRETVKTIATAGVVALILGGVSLLGALAWFSRDLPSPDKLIERSVPYTTKIYDRTGEKILYEIYGQEKRTKISLSNVPDFLKWATIVAEDKEFYSHRGFNLKGMVRALLVNIFKGGIVQGGSSITQQFIKNALLSPEKTFSRKIKEIVLAYRLESKFTKDEILEMYFNEIPYGGLNYGAEAAAKSYFSKQARDLTLAESALLASLTKAPSYYSPDGTHKDELISRQHYILNTMVEEGYISKEEAEKAKKEKLEFKPLKETILAPHFVMYVKEVLALKFGEKVVEQDGLKVITTLDLYKQKIAEEIVEEQAEKNEKNWQAENAALITLDPKTGEILAMVGSRDYFDDEIQGQVNVSLRPRQPGSSFKPIVYSAAFEKGFSPETILFDLVTVFKTEIKDYEPHNYDDKEHGPVSIRKALAGSLNIPAVKTIYLTGISNVLDLAQRFGYTTFEDRSRFGLSLVLGGGEVKLIEHTAAFGALAREGVYHLPKAILRIEDKNGDILEEYKKEEDQGQKVLGPEIARQINEILSDNKARSFIFGEQNYLNLGDRPVAAKTGTTNDYHDAWTLGYTPSLVTGVWVGNSNNAAMKRGADGSVVAAPIWYEFMKRVLGPSGDLRGTPIEHFKPPSKLELPDKPMLNGKLAHEIRVKIDRASGKLATSLTPESFIEEKIYKEVHTILHYLSKDDPLGPIPEDPSQDPNYTTWEEAVRRWAKEQGYETQERPPAEYDDLHTEENRPLLEVRKPSNNESILKPQVLIELSTSAPRGVNRIEFYIDEKFLETKILNLPPNKLASLDFLLNLEKIPISKGQYIFKIKSLDDIDNSKEINLALNFDLSEISFSQINWLKPKEGTVISFLDFPYPIIFDLRNTENYSKVDFYLKNIKDNSSAWLGFVQVQGEKISFVWDSQPSQTGFYQLYLVLTKKNGETQKMDGVSIKITQE